MSGPLARLDSGHHDWQFRTNGCKNGLGMIVEGPSVVSHLPTHNDFSSCRSQGSTVDATTGGQKPRVNPTPQTEKVFDEKCFLFSTAQLPHDFSRCLSQGSAVDATTGGRNSCEGWARAISRAHAVSHPDEYYNETRAQ